MTKKTSEKKEIYKSLKRKMKYSPEVSIKTVEKIMDIVGLYDLTQEQVKQLAFYVENGSLQVEDNKLFYELKKAITVHDGKKKKVFQFSECDDGKLLENGVDMIKHVRESQSGNGTNSDDIRTIVRLSLDLPEDFAKQIMTTDLMIIYVLYSLFFIGL